MTSERTIGFWGATGVGVGAIVGGGVLALAGVAFAATGPSAIFAFAFNGIIAAITALSFAELSTAFPESGGTYTFAKKVLSVKAAFAVGWVVWFASIVAAVLYSLGFATFAVVILGDLMEMIGHTPPPWLTARPAVTSLALVATWVYTIGLVRKGGGGGQWETIGKVILFTVLIAAGIWIMLRSHGAAIEEKLDPFFLAGTGGMLTAMGYTFIALQGFDLIAAVAGEVKSPRRVIPRAMFLSLAIALAIYLPLLLVVATVGIPTGQHVGDLAAANPETIIAIAAATFLGKPGYWLVMVAAILSMISALNANIFAASRVALAMGRDRTLPYEFARIREPQSTPVTALIVSAATVSTLLLLLPNVAAAGAASSLIFLATFAIAQMICILARLRHRADKDYFRAPGFPAVPIIGIIACVSLGVFQSIMVPAAGTIAVVWIALGAVLYWFHFASRAEKFDATSEALDPELIRLRGRTPLVLVPVANPANAPGLVTVANALAPPAVGRILMLSVVTVPDTITVDAYKQPIENSQLVLREALSTSVRLGITPEALTSLAADPWLEIRRVARTHRCESLVLGFSNLTTEVMTRDCEDLINGVQCDVVIIRAARNWQLPDSHRVLVPVGGRSSHGELRARILGSLCRTGQRIITFLRVLPPETSDEAVMRVREDLARLAVDETGNPSSTVLVIRTDMPQDELINQARKHDLVILGLAKKSHSQKLFGGIVVRIAQETTCPLIMISQTR